MRWMCAGRHATLIIVLGFRSTYEVWPRLSGGEPPLDRAPQSFAEGVESAFRTGRRRHVDPHGQEARASGTHPALSPTAVAGVERTAPKLCCR